MSRLRLRLAWISVAVSACAWIGCGAPAVQCPEPKQPLPIQAWARVELETSAEPGVRDRFLDQLRSPALLVQASRETEQPIATSDLQLAAETPTRIVMRIRGDGRQAATARCLAVLRVAERERERALQSDPARIKLSQERDQLRADLRGLEKSLREISADGGVADAVSVQAELVRLKLVRLQIQIAESIERAAGTRDAPELLRTIARAASAAQADVQRLRLEGRGSNHPDVVIARRRVDTLQVLFRAQREAESTWLAISEAELARVPAKGGSADARKARLAALVALLDVPEATAERGVSSEAPLRLRLLAWEYLERRVEDDALSVTFGERHPVRLQSQARMRAVAQEFDTERRMLVGMAKMLLGQGVASALGGGDVRTVRLDEVKVRLVHVLERLDAMDEAAVKSAGNVRVSRDCQPE
ncbi:MAG: hypothetical protein HY898_02500 [Deltaproteobacteria bacterium]|nr:hypothetical protein [Deltaproteobacteria bacterium]